MFKQALTIVTLIAFFVLSAFTDSKNEKWMATLQLEGTTKPIVLTSEAVYGGYNQVNKKFFFFGKNQMFSNLQDADNAQIFRDLCVTNASGQFQFELNGVQNPTPDKNTSFAGSLLFTKKFPIQGTVSSALKNKLQISVTGDLKTLGYKLTPEAQKVMTGKFTLIFEKQ